MPQRRRRHARVHMLDRDRERWHGSFYYVPQCHYCGEQFVWGFGYHMSELMWFRRRVWGELHKRCNWMRCAIRASRGKPP